MASSSDNIDHPAKENVMILATEDQLELKRQREEFEQEKQEWIRNCSKLSSDLVSEDKIRLDIGGQVFVTSLDTLTKIPGSLFDSMFSGRWSTKVDSDGSFFIDRDPTVFSFLLNFLREYPNIFMRRSHLSDVQVQLLRRDADFYRIIPLLHHLKPLYVS